MEKISHVSSIHHVDAHKCVGKNAHAIKMELVVKSIVGAPRAAKIVLEDAIVPKASAEAVSAHALQLDVNATLMSAGIVGLAVEMAHWASHHHEGMVISVAT